MRPVVLVEWLDASTPLDGLKHLDDEDVDEAEPVTVISVGHLLRQDDRVIVLCRDDIEGRWRAVLTIPTRNMIRIRQWLPEGADVG